jgi:hypothetical protein
VVQADNEFQSTLAPRGGAIVTISISGSQRDIFQPTLSARGATSLF